MTADDITMQAAAAGAAAVRLEEEIEVQRHNASPWPSPTTFQEYEVPVFPTEVMSDGIKEMIASTALTTQTPADLGGFSAIAAVSAAVQKKITVSPKEGWVEQLGTYGMVVLESGTRKSAVHAIFTKPIHFQELKAREEQAEEIEQARSAYRMMQRRLEYLEGKTAKESDSIKRSALEDEAKQVAAELINMKNPDLPRYVTSDTTIEALAQTMFDNDEKMAILSAEGGIFLIACGLYSRGVPSFDLLLKSFTGEAVHVDRKSGRSIRLDCPVLTMGLSVQPAVLWEINQTPQLTDKGLVPRFMWATPFFSWGQRDTNPPPTPWEVSARYNEIITTLFELPVQRNDQGRIEPYQLQFSSEAYAAFDIFHKQTELQQADEGELGPIRSWGSKLPGLVARIAGLFHMADNYTHPAPWEVLITEDTVNRAIRFGQYLIPHALAAYGMMKTDPDVENAKYLLGRLKHLEQTAFTRNDLFQATKGKFKKVISLKAPLRLLEEHHYIRERVTSRPAHAGRPKSPTYEVNPHVAPNNPHNPQNSTPDHSGKQSVNNFEDKKDEIQVTQDPF